MSELTPGPAEQPSRVRRAVARALGAAAGIVWLGFFGWLLVERTDPIGAWVKNQGGDFNSHSTTS